MESGGWPDAAGRMAVFQTELKRARRSRSKNFRQPGARVEHGILHIVQFRTTPAVLISCAHHGRARGSCSCGCRKIRGTSRKIRGPSRPRVSWHTACTELGNHPRMGSLVARGARCPEAPSQLFGPEVAACASPWRNDEAHRCAHPGPTEPPRARDSRQESMHRVRSGWLWSSMRRPGNPRLVNKRSSHSEYAICAIPSICPAEVESVEI